MWKITCEGSGDTCHIKCPVRFGMVLGCANANNILGEMHGVSAESLVHYFEGFTTTGHLHCYDRDRLVLWRQRSIE